MAEQAVIRIDVDTGEGRASVEQLEASLEELDVAAVEAGEGVDRMSVGARDAATELQSAGRQVDQFSGKAQTMRSSASASASALGFELVQGAQDAKFGMAGLANQIPLMTEQFTRLQEKTGGTRGALSALVGALKGPVGVIGAFTLLLTFQDEIVGFFQETGRAASEAGEAYKSAAESFFELEGIEIEGEASAEQLRQQRGRIQQAITRLEERRRELSQTAPGPGGGGTPVGPDAEEISRINSRLERYQQILGEIATQLDKRAQTLQLIRDAQGDLLMQVEQTSPENQIIPAESAGLGELTLSGFAQRLTEATEKTEDLAAMVRGLGGAFDEAAFRQERFNQALQNIVARREQRSRQRRNLRAAGLSPGLATQQAPQIGARGPEQFGRELSGMIEQGSREMTRNFEQAGQEVEDGINLQLEQGIRLASQLGSTLVQSAQEGSLTFQQAFSSILGVVGSVLGGRAGAAIAGGGQLIGSFQSGGIVDTPLQIVGESGPELAAMPRGTRVSSNRDTMAMMNEMIRAVGGREVVLPISRTRERLIEDDVRQGSRTGAPKVVNVENLD